ncbi:MAG: C40 family peptidase [bacterium]|nr:C40 family peptidase [bacterium]
MQHDFGDKWRRKVAEENLDARIAYWEWSHERRLLRTRPGPATKLAELQLAGLDGEGVEHEVIETVGWGVITANRTALRREPGHAEEQISQLRYGEVFEVWAVSESEEWLLGCGADAYPGWLRSWHLQRTPARPHSDTQMVVVARSSRACSAPRADAPIIEDLSFATRLLVCGDDCRGYTPWHTPLGAVVWSPTKDLAPVPDQDRDCNPREDLLAMGFRLLGAPYEWGGCSTWGFDCSGLVQALYSSVGIALPRDADMQALCGAPRDIRSPATWQPGDLLFFGNDRVDHVGVLIGEGRLLHARGFVKIDDLAELETKLKLNLLDVRNPC